MTIFMSKRPPKQRFQLRQIYGNCLEKLGVRNIGGGYAIIDRNIRPKVGDIVHCAKGMANISSYLKQVKRIEGDSVIVGTAYYDETKDYEFEASEIYGVVIETYGGYQAYREYVRPTHLRKKKLKKEEERENETQHSNNRS